MLQVIPETRTYAGANRHWSKVAHVRDLVGYTVSFYDPCICWASLRCCQACIPMRVCDCGSLTERQVALLHSSYTLLAPSLSQRQTGLMFDDQLSIVVHFGQSFGHGENLESVDSLLSIEG